MLTTLNWRLPILVCLFILYLVWTIPALFWGTKRIDELPAYNLHPDERTHLAAIHQHNYLNSHWDGAGYYNLVNALYYVGDKSSAFDRIQSSFDLQENGPILLVGRFLNVLLVFVSGLLVFRLLNRFTGSLAFSYAGLLLYLAFPAMQVSGHYLRPYMSLNFFVLLFLDLLSRYFQEKKEAYIIGMFLISGFLFSLRYPFGFFVLFPVCLLFRSGDTRKLIPYAFLTVAAAFVINPWFFIHLRTSLYIAANAPYSTKLHGLREATSLAQFFAVLNPLQEVKTIFLRVLPDSMGSLYMTIALLVCCAIYLFSDRKNRTINFFLIFLLYYLATWIVLGQTISDGLSRFSLPFLILFSLLVPASLHTLSRRYRQLFIPAICLGILMIANAFVYSSELLYEMAQPDPRFAVLQETQGTKINFLDQIGWDYGLFTEMHDRVHVLKRSDLPQHREEPVWFIDIATHTKNPYPNDAGLTLEKKIEPKHWLWFWNDDFYLHDYRYFAPTVYKFRIGAAS